MTNSATTTATIPANCGTAAKPFYILSRHYWTGAYSHHADRLQSGLSPDPAEDGDVMWVNANAPVSLPRYASNGGPIFLRDGRVRASFLSTQPKLFDEVFESLAEAEDAMHGYVGHNHVYGFEITGHCSDDPMDMNIPFEIRRYDAQGTMFECATPEVTVLDQQLRSGELVQFTDGRRHDRQSIGILLDTPATHQYWIPVVVGTFDDELTNLKVVSRFDVRRPAYPVHDSAARQLADALQEFEAQRPSFSLEPCTAKLTAFAAEAAQMESARATAVLAGVYAELDRRYDNPLGTLLCECARGWSSQGSSHPEDSSFGLAAFERELRDKPGLHFNPRARNTAFRGHYLANINQIIRLACEMVEVCTYPDVCLAVSRGAVQRVNRLLSGSNAWAQYLKWNSVVLNKPHA